MKIAENKNKLSLILIIVLGLLASILAVHLLVNQLSDTSQITTPTQDGIDSQKQDVKPEYTDPSASQTGVNDASIDDSDDVDAFPTTQPNLTISIKSIHQKDGLLFVDNIVTPAVNSGRCTIRLTRSVEQLDDKSFSSSGDSCHDAQISTSGIAKGELTVTILIQVGNNVANSSQPFVIK